MQLLASTADIVVAVILNRIISTHNYFVMKFFALLIGVVFLGFGQPNPNRSETVTPETTVIATVELTDGTIYSERLLTSDVKYFGKKMTEMFGEDAFCCCSYEFDGGACYRRRNTCAEALEAFCTCAAEEQDLEPGVCE